MNGVCKYTYMYTRTHTYIMALARSSRKEYQVTTPPFTIQPPLRFLGCHSLFPSREEKEEEERVFICSQSES